LFCTDHNKSSWPLNTIDAIFVANFSTKRMEIKYSTNYRIGTYYNSELDDIYKVLSKLFQHTSQDG